MFKAGKILGALVVLFFIWYLLPLILPIAFFAFPPIRSPLPVDLFVIFWGYRWYDIIFLALAIFATIAGISSLFRPEKTEISIEESVTEGYTEEEFEEEE